MGTVGVDNGHQDQDLVYGELAPLVGCERCGQEAEPDSGGVDEALCGSCLVDTAVLVFPSDGWSAWEIAEIRRLVARREVQAWEAFAARLAAGRAS